METRSDKICGDTVFWEDTTFPAKIILSHEIYKIRYSILPFFGGVECRYQDPGTGPGS